MSNDLYSTASKRNCFSCGEQMLAPADHPMPLCPSCAPEYGMPGLKKTFGENPKGKYGTDRGGDDYYEVSHPAGYTIRSYSMPGVGSDYFSIHDETGSEFEDGKRVNHEVDGFVRPNKEEGKVTHEEMEKHLGDWVSENHPELKSEGSKTAGMFYLPPKFEPGDHVIDSRGEYTVHSVYDSGHPGKSNKMKVIKDGETKPMLGLYSEKGYNHHPDAPAEQIERSERRINDAKNAREAIDSAFTSVDQAHDSGAKWLLDNNPTGPSKYSSKTSGRNGVTCPKCQRWFDLDDAPQDWYSHNCESSDSKSTAAKTAGEQAPYDRHWDAYDAARDAGQASPQGGRTGSINNEVLDSHLTIGSTSMKVIASTPTHEISQVMVPAESDPLQHGPRDCGYCDDGTKATHHLMTFINDIRPQPDYKANALSLAYTCEDHLAVTKDEEHTNAISWLARQGSLKTKSVGKQVCQTCRHSDDAHKVSTEWYCNPGEGGCGGNGVLSESINQPYSSDHEDGCENPGAVEYNDGNEYCQGGVGRKCICEGFANTKPKWFVDDEPQSAADDTDGDDYVNPNDDDDSGFFNNLRTKSSKWDTCLCGHGRPEHRDVDFKGDGKGHCLTCESDLTQWDRHDCGVHGEFTDAEDHEEMDCTGDEETCKYGENGGWCEHRDCDEDAMTGYHYCSRHFDNSRFASYVGRVSTPAHLAAILQWTNDSLAVTASYDSLFHPDAADHSSVVPMTCHECEEDYDAPAWGGVIMADECPNCGSDATYQKGKKNTFAEDAREDWNEQDPR